MLATRMAQKIRVPGVFVASQPFDGYIDTYEGVATTTLGPHQVGDVFIAIARRSGSSNPPQIGDDSWNLEVSGGSNALGYLVAWKVAQTTNEPVGNFVNTSAISIIHYRPDTELSPSLGVFATSVSTATLDVSIPAATLEVTDGSSRVFGVYLTNSDDITGLDTAPSGMVHCKTNPTGTGMMAIYRSSGGVADWTAKAVDVSGTLSTHRCLSIELKLVTGTPVNVPTGLGASVSSGNITLSWTDTNAGAAQTSIEVSLNGTSGWTFVATKAAGVTTHLIPAAQPGTTYYRIRAQIGSSYSSYTSAVSATVAVTVNAPTSPSAIASGANITVSATDTNSGNARLAVERSANGTSGWTEIAVTATGVMSYLDASRPDGTYYYRLRALISSVYSSYTSVVSATVSSGGGIVLPAPNLVLDNFETSDLTPGGTSCDLNAGGLFTWDGTYGTSIVGMPGGVATRIYPTPQITYPGQDLTPKQGNRCMRVRYTNEWMMSEQRFSLGAHYTDVWVRYWIRIPSTFNYQGSNAKWAAFWTNGYDGPGDVTFQLRPQGSGNAKLVVQDGGVAVGEVDVYADFINAVRDAGRWMQIVYHLRPESSNGALNGQIRVWRRWDGDNTWTQIYNKLNAGFYEGGVGVHQGYILGSAEGGSYVGNGEHPYLVDTFEASTASLV